MDISEDETLDSLNIKIKIEPEDTDYHETLSSLSYEDVDVKVEIKEEIESDDGSIEEDSPSPALSLSALSPDSTCKVEILEQPIKKVRFRYLSELQGTPHGPILGEKHTKNLKTFPKVRLIGYEGREPVKMRCWLVDKPESPKDFIRPHCHDLAVRKFGPKNEIVTEPHEVNLSRENNYIATFENMVVLHNVLRGSELKYHEKEVKWDSRDYTKPQKSYKLNKKKTQDTIKSINKNEVYLYFEAYIEYRSSIQILCSTLSDPIKNLKNPLSGDLKICKVLNNFGPREGNTEIGLFTEKVPPDVKIKFFQNETGWEVCVLPEFIHRNLALTIRSPQYPYPGDDAVKVNFCLLREADGVESNKVEFTYQMSEYAFSGFLGCKRKRTAKDSIHADKSSDDSLMDSDECSSKSLIDNLTLGGLMGGVCEENIHETFHDELANVILMDSESSNDNRVTDWSGTSLEMALGNPFIDSTLGDSIESDGLSHFKEQDKIGGRGTSGSLRSTTVNQNISLSRYLNCLHEAIIHNRVDDVKKILYSLKEYSNPPVNNSVPLTKFRDENYQTFLHQAIVHGRFNLVVHLLEFGFDPSDRDRQGNNAFHLAVKSKTLQTLKILIENCIESSPDQTKGNNTKKYPPSETNYDGQDILHLAVRAMDINFVKYIVKLAYFNVNSLEKNSGDTPLHIACRLQAPEIAKVLLHNGADTQVVNLQGYTPLHVSVALNDHKMASLLMKEKSGPPHECFSTELREYGSFLEEDTSEDWALKTDNLFSLAVDFMMVDILKGETSKYESIEDSSQDVPTNVDRVEKTKACLLTPDKISKLSVLLKENDIWVEVAKKLNKPHLEALCKNLAQPEMVLLKYIEKLQNEIFGDGDDQIEQLANVFESLNLKKAKSILES